MKKVKVPVSFRIDAELYEAIKNYKQINMIRMVDFIEEALLLRLSVPQELIKTAKDKAKVFKVDFIINSLMLPPDEVPIIAHTGERILSRKNNENYSKK